MKKPLSIIYISLCLSLCILPFFGMLFAPSNRLIGNEQATEIPSIQSENETINQDYLKELGDYFSTHFAFRPQLVNLDANIQSKMFSTSNLSSIIVGKNDTLFYASTLDNYLGKNLMSEREIFNILNNLQITQDYLSQKNIQFLFTVAPNKNSLYSENMPYYYQKKESSIKNLTLLNKEIENSSLSYCNLYKLFKSQNEVLYFKRDSHWNEKGALLSYNKILNTIDKPHNDYLNVPVKKSKTFVGDLAKMLYPSNSEPEFCYQYDISPTYTYVTPTKSVEDAIIETENKGADGSLYMYRDSFGNSLVPFFANAYNKAYFTKMFPINLEFETTTQKSDTVIFEIVERNLSWFSENPPVLSSPECDIPKLCNAPITANNQKAQISNVNTGLVCLSGEIKWKGIENNSEIFLLLSDKNGTKRLFKAFTVSSTDTDFGFKVYIPASQLDNQTVTVQPIIKNGQKYYSAASTTLKIEPAEF